MNARKPGNESKIVYSTGVDEEMTSRWVLISLFNRLKSTGFRDIIITNICTGRLSDARVVEWQTRKHEGLMPKGVGVQLPPRAPKINPASHTLAFLKPMLASGIFIGKLSIYLRLSFT